MSEFHDNYSWLDKALHKLAFKTVPLQLRLAAVESDERRRDLSSLKVEKPIFITSLPRSGTTILLEVLSKTGLFCHHTYADMPFVFTPLLWQKFAGRFTKQDELVERAHGDGIKINQQSPEAFEEMFYKAFWPGHYRDNRLAVWSAEPANKDFDRFFTAHIAKLMLRDNQSRYLSKNNLNIIRLDYLKRLFPDGRFVVPVREPLAHAMSLLRQHQNFTKLHEQNPFAKAYMEGIGHYDFGANLKPVNFNGWLDDCPYEPMQLDFWLAYWIASYQYLLDSKPFVHFVCFESLCAQPSVVLDGLATELDIPAQPLLAQIRLIKQGKTAAVDSAGLNQDHLAKAQALYWRLSGKI